MKSAALLLIRGYQRLLSPGIGAVCRYEPSCSRYAYEAIDRFGVARGGWLALKRLARCHPWHAGGFDPVPEVKAGHRAALTSAPSTARRS